MRFQRKQGKIDMELAQQQLLQAFEGGVNYYDTAYIYPGSEAAIGEIFEKNGIREKLYIATKLPHYLIKSRESIDKIFAEELRRLRTDYVDYYLMHMLTDVAAWERMKSLGIVQWLEEKKKSGAIRQVGFSYHGGSEEFCKLIDAYDWDFCQIQYNYMDEHSQAGRRGLQYAHEKGIPVIIMEPLRGGKLVNRLPQKALEVFANYPTKRTPAQWAFRWLWDQKEVTCVLSGMNSMEMLADNVQTASETEIGELTQADQAMLKQVVAAINDKMKVGCTGCAYCMPCPKQVNIPGTFAAYNRRYQEGKFWGLVEYVMASVLQKDSTVASACVGCGKCEQHCPQHLPIREKLKEASKELESPLYRVARAVIKPFTKF
jgi:predicted aldo/keto reductase-like oxidoreductase